MAVRPFWKGYLKLSLVTCPVALMPATSESDRVRFHTINRETGHRIHSRYVDSKSGKPVEDEDQVKGYQRGDDDYVMLEDEELDAVALESARTIDIEMFVPKSSIEWIWYDTPHFLLPNDKVGEEAYTVIRDAMRETKTAAISRVVLYRRERAVMLDARDNGIILWTLRYGDEVRDQAETLTGIKHHQADAKKLSLVTKLIEERTKPWSPDMMTDPVQDKLIEIIAAKKAGKAPARPADDAQEEAPSNVINIMDALRKSLGGKSAAVPEKPTPKKRKPAKKATPRARKAT